MRGGQQSVAGACAWGRHSRTNRACGPPVTRSVQPQAAHLHRPPCVFSHHGHSAGTMRCCPVDRGSAGSAAEHRRAAVARNRVPAPSCRARCAQPGHTPRAVPARPGERRPWDTALAREWRDSSTAVLGRPTPVATPFTEELFLDPVTPRAAAYIVTMRRGQRCGPRPNRSWHSRHHGQRADGAEADEKLRSERPGGTAAAGATPATAHVRQLDAHRSAPSLERVRPRSSAAEQGRHGHGQTPSCRAARPVGDRALQRPGHACRHAADPLSP